MSDPTSGQTSAKRKKNSYYRPNAKKSKQCGGHLDEGMTGFMATCNLKEYQCLREAYNLLNEFADKCYKTSDEEVVTSEIDIEAAVESEIKSLKETPKRFQQVITKCNNVLFIKSNDKLVDPLVMCSEILREIENNGKQLTQHLLRLIPIVATFKTNTDFGEELKRHLEKQTEDGISYMIQTKVRNNSEVKRMDLIESAVTVVKEVRPKWTVDFDRPKLTIGLDVLNKIICLSFLEDYQNYCKYNLIEFSKKCLKQTKCQ